MPSLQILETASDAVPSKFGTCVLPGTSFRVRYSDTGHAGNPAVMVLGGISAHRVISTRPDGTPGWWDSQVGPGKAIGSADYRLLGLDYLAGEGISTADQADAMVAVLDRLGISRLHALVGASYGAMVGLAVAERYPQRLQRLVAISGAHRAHPYATALRSIQRRIIRLAQNHGVPEDGVALARSLAMIGYRSQNEFASRFSGPGWGGATGWRFPVDEYLDHHGRRYASAVSPHDYLCLSESLDRHRIDPGAITVPVRLIAADPDQLVPLTDMQALAGKLAGPCRLDIVPTRYGHDAFLKETRQLAPLLEAALEVHS